MVGYASGPEAPSELSVDLGTCFTAPASTWLKGRDGWLCDSLVPVQNGDAGPFVKNALRMGFGVGAGEC